MTHAIMSSTTTRLMTFSAKARSSCHWEVLCQKDPASHKHISTASKAKIRYSTKPRALLGSAHCLAKHAQASSSTSTTQPTPCMQLHKSMHNVLVAAAMPRAPGEAASSSACECWCCMCASYAAWLAGWVGCCCHTHACM